MSFAVTVLMPVFNASKYVAEAIDSILNQTFTNFEFLIIDDGSSDNGVEIIKSYNDTRIRLVLNQSNMGLSATLNKGIALAKSELIARMDADDISHPDRLKRQYEYFQREPGTALLSTSVKIINDDKSVVEIFDEDKYYVCYSLNFYCSIYHPTVMYRRSVVAGIGGYKMRYSEDFDLWWRLMSANNQIGHIKAILVDYRLSETSLSHVARKKEYVETTSVIMLRNLRFYTGSDFHLSDAETEALLGNFPPLLESNSIAKIARFFEKLNYINHCIYQQANINYSPSQLAPYAAIKEDEAFNYFYVRLARHKAFYLLLKIKSIKGVLKRIRDVVGLG